MKGRRKAGTRSLTIKKTKKEDSKAAKTTKTVAPLKSPANPAKERTSEKTGHKTSGASFWAPLTEGKPPAATDKSKMVKEL